MVTLTVRHALYLEALRKAERQLRSAHSQLPPLSADARSVTVVRSVVLDLIRQAER